MTTHTKFQRAVAASLLALTALSTPAHAATQPQIDTAWSKGLAYLIKNQNGDGSWDAEKGVGVHGTTSGLLALDKAGLKNFSYAKALAWVGSAAHSLGSHLRGKAEIT